MHWLMHNLGKRLTPLRRRIPVVCNITPSIKRPLEHQKHPASSDIVRDYRIPDDHAQSSISPVPTSLPPILKSSKLFGSP